MINLEFYKEEVIDDIWCHAHRIRTGSDKCIGLACEQCHRQTIEWFLQELQPFTEEQLQFIKQFKNVISVKRWLGTGAQYITLKMQKSSEVLYVDSFNFKWDNLELDKVYEIQSEDKKGELEK